MKQRYLLVFLLYLSLIHNQAFANGPVYNFNFYNGDSSKKTNVQVPAVKKEEQAILDKILDGDSSSQALESNQAIKDDAEVAAIAKTIKEKRDARKGSALDFSIINYNLTYSSDIKVGVSGASIGLSSHLGSGYYFTPSVMFLSLSSAGGKDYIDEDTTTHTAYKLALSKNFSISESFSIKLGMSAYKITHDVPFEKFGYESSPFVDWSLVDNVDTYGAEATVGLNLEFSQIDLYLDLAYGRGKLDYDLGYLNPLNEYFNSSSVALGARFYL